MEIIHKLTITVVFSMFCALTNAQNNMSSALDELASKCQEVIDLNDTIKNREAMRDELYAQVEDLKEDWWNTCSEALSSPACDDNATRINIINELIGLTDPAFEKNLLDKLTEAKDNPEIRSLPPYVRSSSSPRRKNAGQRNPGQKDTPAQHRRPARPEPKAVDDSSDTKKEEDVNPVTEEQPKKKDEPAASPSSKGPQKENPGNKGKNNIKESKDQNNRNKTIQLMNSKNKNQNK